MMKINTILLFVLMVAKPLSADDDALFDEPHGDTKIRIQFASPQFEKQEAYQLFYKNPSAEISFAVERFLFNWYAAVGYGFRLGFYKDQGNTRLPVDGGGVGEIASESHLSILPVETYLTWGLSPFRSRYIQAYGHFGIHYDLYEESRKSVDAGQAYVNSGWIGFLSTRVGIDFLLNPLESRSTAALQTINLQACYLGVFLGWDQQLETENVPNFSRTSLGISFTFES